MREGRLDYGAGQCVDRVQEIAAAGGHAPAMEVTDDAVMVAVVERIPIEQVLRNAPRPINPAAGSER